MYNIHDIHIHTHSSMFLSSHKHIAVVSITVAVFVVAISGTSGPLSGVRADVKNDDALPPNACVTVNGSNPGMMIERLQTFHLQGGNVYENVNTCPTGTECRAGACVNAPGGCIDRDARSGNAYGDNTKIQSNGSVLGKTGDFNDRCDGNILIEFICWDRSTDPRFVKGLAKNASEGFSWLRIACANGCRDGVCL